MTENAKNVVRRVLGGALLFKVPARHKKDESSEWAYGTVEKRGDAYIMFRTYDRVAKSYIWTMHLNSTDTYDLELLDRDYYAVSQKDSIDSKSNSKTIVIEFDRVVLVNQNF